MKKFFLYCIFWIFYLTKCQGYTDCKIDIDLRKKKVPLFFQGYNVMKYHKNDYYTGIINLKHNSTVVLHCHNQTVLHKNDNITTSLNTSLIQLLCFDNILYYGKSKVLHSKYECSDFMTPIVLRNPSFCNPVNINGEMLVAAKSSLVFLEFGFKFFKKFFHQFTICFDEHMQIALWSYHVLKFEREEVSVQIVKPPFFVTNLPGQTLMYKGLPNKTLFSYYSQKGQIELFSENFQTNKKKCFGKDVPIIKKNELKFNKGHLTPKADFSLEPYRQATYFYANVFPQSSYLNSKGWKFLEKGLRQYSRKYDLSLHIFTGLFGTISRLNKTKHPKYIHLIHQKNWIPFPRYIWKFAYHKDSKAGIVFLGNNDHFRGENVMDLCASICINTTFYQLFEKLKKRQQQILCCEYKSLKKIILSLPTLEVKSIFGKI